MNGSTLFINENIGLSSLSTYIGPAISSISSFVDVIKAISSGFSTLGLAVPRISTLSSLYGYRITPDNTSTGVSTLTASMSTLVTSTLTVQYLNLWSTFASTIYTSSLNANAVSSFSQAKNSYFIASTVSTGQAYISTFPIGIQINSMSTNTLTFNLLNATNITANTFFASTIRTNTASAGNSGTVFLKDNGTSYTTSRPLEFSTFYPLYGSGGFLAYNSTIYSGGLDINNYSYALSTSFLSVSTVGSGVIYTSTIQFTGKVQFDRLVVMQSTITPMFVALESGGFNGSASSNPGRLYVSPDGITWSNVNTTGQPSWVGKDTQHGTYPSGTQLRLAWNGTYFIAYSVMNNGDIGGVNRASSNNAISYDGINWSNVNRRTLGQTGTTFPLVSIIWDGTRWIKTHANTNCNTTEESGDSASYDGINWQRLQWATGIPNNGTTAPTIANAFSLNQCNAAGSSALSRTTPYSLFYNGNTLINYGAAAAPVFSDGVNGCMITYSHDLLNTFPFFSEFNGGLSLGLNTSQGNSTGLVPWSDGLAWWFPNTATASSAAVRGGLFRCYTYNNSTGAGMAGLTPGILNDSSQYFKQCYGVGFNLSNSNLGAVPFCGYYNGQMHVLGMAKSHDLAFNSGLLTYPSSQTLTYSYDGIYFFPSPSVQGIRAGGSVRTITYASGKWVVGATGNINGSNNSDGAVNAGTTIWYSYDGLNWNPGQMTPSQVTQTWNGFSNLQGATYNSNTNDTVLGGGITSIVYMSNMNPAIDFNGVRIYNQPNGGICWNNNVTREQSIVAYQSSIMLHNMILISGDNSVSSLVAGTNIRVGIANHNPSTTLDLGGVATVTAERLYTSSLYILPSTGTNMFSESYLPLSSFNFYVHGSTFMSRLAVNVPRPVTILDISGANALFRSQGADCNAAAKTYLTTLVPDNNVILGPSMMYNSTCMSLFYKSGGTTYKRSYGGSNFFTGQHATVCLDLSGALVSSITSTITESGITFSTIWTDYSGYLLSSADLGYMSIPNSNLRLWASNAINVTEALPYTRITTKDKDPAVFGIVTNNTNNGYNEDGSWLLDSDTMWGNDLYGRVRVNSIGEGALWVTNVNGNISNGDFLCSSAVPGHARKQDEDGAYNFTVAKATMSCTFDLGTSNYRCETIEYNGSTFVRAYIGVTYNCG